MIQGIDNTSLALVERLREFVKLAWDTNAILQEIFHYNKTNLSRFSELQESLEKLQLRLPLIRMDAQTLQEAYVSQYAGLFGEREILNGKIEKCRSKGNQTNSLPSQYDEENFINEIIPCNKDDHTEKFRINGARIDPIIDPASYSNGAIVKRFEMEDHLIGELSDDSFDLFKIIEKSANAALQDILDAINFCIDPEITNLTEKDFYRDSNEYDSAVQQKIPIRQIVNYFSGSSKAVLKAFNVLQEMLHNYEIYTSAITSYTATALESVLGPRFDYTLN